ncbi:putative alpha-mannosidase [Zea mays]|uniref:Alpha-mannosidase n=1 Tax=Zea mays TaxID=4577 RepID=A0A1D6F5T3_MAIZE|nr:putative alpha-mannosidase [Zea mays]
MGPVRLALLLSVAAVLAAAGAVYIPYNTSAGVVPGKLNVHVVPHTHDDVGWLKTVDQYYVGSNNSIQGACVQNVLDSLIPALLKDENRKFIYVEQAFFQRWWRNQNDMIKDTVKGLISSGRLELINGGMCMHDEAAVHYIDMIDQTTLGHKYIKEEFGQIPRIGWQIDPFGHSAVQAYLLGAEVGFDAFYFFRIDYQDRDTRKGTKELEVVWRGSKTLGSSADIFAGIFPKNYEPPPGDFYFEVDDNSPVVQDDPLLFDYNVEERVNDFVAAAVAQANITRTNHIMFTMGTDFKYQYAESWFRNMDKLIHYVNKDGRINALYSTPSIYTDAKYAANEQWPLKTNDFFPYADNPNAYWTGYFTSRPALKRYVRMMSGYYLAARQLEFFKGRYSSGLSTDSLGDALALAQHHDAVTGTEKQHVANDYAKRLSIGYTQAQELVSTSLACLTESGSKSRCASPVTKFSQVSPWLVFILFYQMAPILFFALRILMMRITLRVEGVSSRLPMSLLRGISNVELREVDVDAQFQSHGPVVSSCAVSAECSSLQGGGQFSVHECPGSGQLIECPEELCQFGSQQGVGQISVLTEELCQFGSQQGVGQISVLTGPGNGQLNGCLEDHNQIGCQQVGALAGNLGSVADCEVLLPRESPVAATSPPLLLRPKPIQVYFRRRRGARRVEETALGSSPSQPPAAAVNVSTSRVSEFLSSITKECLLLNVTYCPPSEMDLTKGKSLVVLVYNSLGWKREDVIRIPVFSDSIVVHDSEGREIESQLLPIATASLNIREKHVKAYLGTTPGAKPKFWLAFPVSVPPLGFNTYFVSNLKKSAHISSKSTQYSPQGSESSNLQVGQGNLKLQYNEAGKLSLYSDSKTMVQANFEQKYKYYIGQDGNGSDPQASGAYIFRPNGTVPISTDGQVGPIPVDDGNGKEVATEIVTNMVTNKTFYTDSSGRDFIKRIRDYRSEWKIEVHQPIAGNYYPVNLGIYVEDGSKELSVLVDRSIGGSSIKDGQIELMLHRRLLHDDGKGVAEALNETVCLDKQCEGLIIQGKYYVKIDPQGEGARWRRTFGQEIYSPLLLAFTEQDGGNWANSHVAKFSAMDSTYSLPDNVAMLTLQELEDGSVLLRFAHLYEAGEDKDLSSLASIDLKRVFPEKKIGKVIETSLSANQERAAMEKKRLKWKAQGSAADEKVVRGGPVDPSKLVVELGPMEIRTFIVSFDHISDKQQL